MNQKNTLRARRIKAARALLAWSQEDLAHASQLSIATIRNLELGYFSTREGTATRVQNAFELAGLEFVEPAGVRLKPEEIVIYQGLDGAREFFDDVYVTAKKKKCEVVLLYPSVRRYFTEILGDYSLIHIERMRAIKDIVQVKCIVTEDRDSLDAAAYCEYRWISRNYVDAAPFYVYDDKYAIIIRDADQGPKIIVIQSRTVAEALRQQFYSMWEKATPLNKISEAVSVKKKR